MTSRTKTTAHATSQPAIKPEPTIVEPVAGREPDSNDSEHLAPISIDMLKVFCALVRFRSFTKAGAVQRPPISQSVVSQIIRQLEDRLGVSLINRETRPIQVTPPGRVYYDGCNELVERYDELEARLRNPAADQLSVPTESLAADAVSDVEKMLAEGEQKEQFERDKPLETRDRERESVPPEEQELNETGQPGFVEREQRRRGPGRPKQRREPIRWQEVMQFAADAADQQAHAVERFQAILDDALAGTAGGSPEENKALAKAINNLADRLGVDLTSNGQTVNLIWNSGVFIARSKGTSQATQDSSAGFPHLTAQPRPPTEEVDIASWALRAKLGQKAGRAGGKKK